MCACGNHNYASRAACGKCRAPKGPIPVSVPWNGAGITPTNASRLYLQSVPVCDTSVGINYFAMVYVCQLVHEHVLLLVGNMRGGMGGMGLPANFRPGDWMCQCGNHNYQSRSNCGKCNQPKEVADRTVKSCHCCSPIICWSACHHLCSVKHFSSASTSTRTRMTNHRASPV